MNIILLGIIIVESAVLLLLAVRGELTLQKQEQTKKPSTPYDRVLEFCDQELLPVCEFEKINLIPIGTIEKWKTQQPDLKYLTKAALYMKVSPFWLETGKPINNITIREEFIIYILRHMDDEHYRKIVNSSIHEAFTIFEIDE
jgi:hypothetical protein